MTFALDIGSSTVCGSDLNGDGGFYAQNELAACVNGVCPFQTATCTATLSDPTCPTGGTLNTTRDTCQAPATSITCPTGYTYDNTLDRCVAAVVCPSGGILNTTTDQCEKVVSNVCPTGYTYDSARDVCWKTVDCGAGTFVAARDRCELAATQSCPTGYTLNSGTGKCEAAPICSQGAYNTTYNKCLLAYTIGCPAGTAYNSTRGRCEATPSCSSGTYNPVTDKCQTWTTSTYAATPAYYTQCVVQVRTLSYTWGYPMYSGPTNYYSVPGGILQNLLVGPPDIGWIASTDNSCNITHFTNYDINGINIDNYTVVAPGSSQYTYYVGQGYIAITNLSTPSSYTCNAGDTLSGTTCTHTTLTQTNPTCPSSTTFDGTTDTCWAAYNIQCPTGMIFDAGSGQCAISATCNSNGVLNTTTDKCELAIIQNCGTWIWDNANSICYSSPVCNLGAFDAVSNQCLATITRDCGTTYTYNSTTGKCLLAPPCTGSGTYSTTLNTCLNNATHNCPTSYAWNTLPVSMCEAIPICAQGTYDPTRDKCYAGDNTCPLGNYTCTDVNGDGINECSTLPCVNLTTTPATQTPTDTTAYKNDGTVDPATGNCSGVFKIFNGHGGECMNPGWDTTFFNCCDTSSGSFLIFKKFCPDDNVTTDEAVQASRTHYVGEYCKTKIMFIGCIQTAKMYCVFNSKLGRIIQEQGRPQLKKFGPDGGWGTPEAPNCEGFTPEEFQTLDFSKIDLSEAFGDIVPAAITNVQTGVNGAVNNFMNNIQK